MRVKDDTKISTIFEATVELTSEVGLNKLTMSSIAEKAQLASGTLYIYFDSKEKLLNELYKHLLVRGTLSLLPSVQHLPLKKQFWVIWSNVLKLCVSNSSEVVFMHQFRYSSYVSEETNELDEQFLSYLKTMLNKGKEELIVKNIDNRLMISLLYGYANTFSRQLVKDKIELTDSLMEQSFRVCWDAIKS
ncbi:TetR/AcrR family transcriptional regulator [Zobellia roscoffensis]|uniref:TetR/AcrR family transcriptional regulator n=1 Tax=Zobellia roscoffensis TaxID=2779508 RepID=UPI00188CD793|nr:TetR/AcrR family transcriptional regulator [Zobellia roscoffensis]